MALPLVGRHLRVAVAAALLCAAASPSLAQILPSRPITIGERVTISGDVSATASCAHPQNGPSCTNDTGFFNYTDYDLSILRRFWAGVSASVRLGDRAAVLGDVRFENTEHPRPYGLYLRLRPWAERAFDIQVGQVPTTFGASARRAYATDNILIGFPLAYQYLTSLRPDALPARPEDLLRMRGRGWLSSYPIGSPTPAAGMPLADAFHWDTGVQVHGVAGWFEAAASVTTGSLANPLFKDDNDGKHVAGRVALRPVAGLVVGLSGSRAPFATSAAAAAAGFPSGDFVQRAIGWDVEYSRDHWLARAESVATQFSMPTIGDDLGAMGTAVEGRYKLTPALHVAARADHLGFSRIATSTVPAEWEAAVTRWEVGGGWAIQRNVQMKLSWQHNTRSGGRVRHLSALAGQLLYWF